MSGSGGEGGNGPSIPRADVIAIHESIREGDKKLHGRVDALAAIVNEDRIRLGIYEARTEALVSDVTEVKGDTKAIRNVLDQLLLKGSGIFAGSSSPSSSAASADEDTGAVAKVSIGGNDLKALAGGAGRFLRWTLVVLSTGTGWAIVVELSRRAFHFFFG